MNYCKVCGKKLELTPEYDMCIECQGKMHRTYTLPNNDGVVSNKSSMNRYDRYEDGIVIDKMSGENNLLELVRVGDMLEAQGVEYVDYIKVNDYDDIRHIQNAIKNNNISAIVAIWFRSGDTMKRIGVEHERV